MEFTLKTQQLIIPSPLSLPHVVTLSVIDQIVPPAYNPFLYFYAAPATPPPSASLTHSLARALSAFPPVAGRLKPRSNGAGVDVECHNQGAVFVEAHASLALHELLNTGNGDVRGGIYQPSHLWDSLAPNPNEEASTDKPLLYTQLTRLGCGGLVVAVLLHHQVADGVAQDHFVASWSELARGEPITVHPLLDRKSMQTRSPPRPSLEHPEYIIHRIMPEAMPDLPSYDTTTDLPPITSRIFEFSREDIQVLKKRASTEAGGSDHVSTGFQVLAAHIWKHVTKARGGDASQLIKLAWAIDGRKRFNPPLPPHYFGNVLFYGLTKGRAGEVMHHTPMRILNATQRFTDEYMHSIIDLIASQDSPALVISPALVDDNLMILRTTGSVMPSELCITSWVHFRSYQVDWGWGSPLFFSTSGSIYEGFVALLPHADGRSVNAYISLFRSHMDALLSDVHFCSV
ncbi:hypothetical protein M758_12G030400 [Ceratodon purpureus]|nr:hypothetical protein M758_12G030400 [Ceratodon purpureus]